MKRGSDASGADFSGNFFGFKGFVAAAVAITTSKLRWLSFASNGNSPGEKLEIPAARRAEG